MKKLTLFLLCALCSIAFGQSKLPQCQGTEIKAWNICSGEITFSDGTKYVGEFKNGQRWGKGTFISSDGKKKFTGDFIGDKFFHGILEFEIRKFEGYFQDEKLSGGGTFSVGEDFLQIGNFKEGQLDGLGVSYIFPNQKNESVQIGEFKNGLLEGKGTYKLGTDPKYLTFYVGDFKRGQFDGTGKKLDMGISSYVGNFKKGLYDGEGVEDGDAGYQYIGTFKGGLYEGNGVLTFADYKYVGEFKNGKPHGQGTLTKYEGEFFRKGRLSNEREPSSVRTGLWANGIFIKAVAPTVEIKKTEMQSLLEKAEKGDAVAQYRYGMALLYGTQDVVEPRVASHWLMKAQAQGHEGARM